MKGRWMVNEGVSSKGSATLPLPFMKGRWIVKEGVPGEGSATLPLHFMKSRWMVNEGVSSKGSGRCNVRPLFLLTKYFILH
jgi:hypothetical protein